MVANVIFLTFVLNLPYLIGSIILLILAFFLTIWFFNVENKNRQSSTVQKKTWSWFRRQKSAIILMLMVWMYIGALVIFLLQTTSPTAPQILLINETIKLF